MLLNSLNHSRNHSAFSKRQSDTFHKRIQMQKLNLKISTSKTTLSICPTQRSQSQPNQTLTHLALSQQIQSPRVSQFHIKTFIRFRPEKIHDKSQKNPISLNNSKIAIIDKKKILCQDNFFAYDHVFEPISQQKEVYQSTCKQMVDHFVRGFNSTVFAYGQTGSGKTYTMFGDLIEESNMGIIPSAIKDIFSFVEIMMKQQQNGQPAITEACVSCSMLEIYKQTMIDLFSTQKSQLKIKENTFFNVSHLTIKQVLNQQEMLQILKTGNQSKKIRQTSMNQTSSRSHVIFTIYLQVRKQNQKRLSKFNLVDLAGSQKVSKSKVQGKGLQQAKKINLSLSCLGNTINALLKRNDHIPFRQSKLTRLLFQSLGGNSLTRLIVTCSSEDTEIEQTLSSLKFAARAKNLKTNPLINTLRKSEKSVSRVAYQNIKTNLNKAENKIKKIKSQLSQFKMHEQTKEFSHHLREQDKENNSFYLNSLHNPKHKNTKIINENEILSETKIDNQKLEANKVQKINSELSRYKIFVQKINAVLLANENQPLLELRSKSPKKDKTFIQSHLNPFLLISEQNQEHGILSTNILQNDNDISNQSDKTKYQHKISHTQQSRSIKYWDVIKSQQREIVSLKRQLKMIKSQKISSQNEIALTNINSPLKTINNLSEIQSRKNSITDFLQKKFTQTQKINLSSQTQKELKKKPKLNIKVINKMLPVRQIYLTSPSNNKSIFTKKNNQLQRSSSNTKQSKGGQNSLNKMSIKSPRQFIITDHTQKQHQQTNYSLYLTKLIEEINQRLSQSNGYQRFEKQLLHRQIQLLISKIVSIQSPQNQLASQNRQNSFESKLYITLKQVNQQIKSQKDYISKLQKLLSSNLINSLSQKPQNKLNNQ